MLSKKIWPAAICISEDPRVADPFLPFIESFVIVLRGKRYELYFITSLTSLIL